MLLLRWLINALALILVSKLLPGFQVDSIKTALIAALILGLVNAIIRPIFLLLTLPINVLTLGTFTFVVNALMLLLVSQVFAVKGFEIHGFFTALIAAILLWLISMVSNLLFFSKPSE